MPFSLFFTDEARKNLADLARDKSRAKRLKAVRKALGYLQLNPKHSSLNTHKYHSLRCPNGEDVFEAYAENNTPAAYRVFWHYGPQKSDITIIAITEHP